MPTSNFYTIPTIIETVIRLNPNSILDFGVGFGKYGFLLREYLDIPKLKKGFNKNIIENFSTRIDGLEADARYISDIQRMFYNKIYIGNGLELIDDLGNYDVVIILDVIEHFKKEDGQLLLEKLYHRTNNTLIITTPNFNYKQGAIFDNVYEKHQSVWNKNDFKEYPYRQFKTIDGNTTLMILLHKDKVNKIKIPTLWEHWDGRQLIKEIIAIAVEAAVKLITKIKNIFYRIWQK